MHNKGPAHIFFLMDKFESWMINPKYFLLISYDINSHTYLIYTDDIMKNINMC